MESLITSWRSMTSMEVMVCISLAINFYCAVRIAFLQHKYYLLNFSLLRLTDRVDPSMITMHRNGDFYFNNGLNKAPTLTDKVDD